MDKISEAELRDALETVGFREDDDDKFVNDIGGELSFYREYGGRGMYGSKCFGIVVNHPATTAMFFCAVREFMSLEDTMYIASALLTDNMGYDTIVYFPGFTLTD